MKKKNIEASLERKEIPIQIWASYFSFIDEPDTTDKDIADFTRALREYAKGNFDFVSDNRYIRSELRQIRVEMKFRWEKYISKCEKLKNNGSEGGKKKAENRKAQNTDNQRENVANATNSVANASENVANASENVANAKKKLANSSNCDIDIDIDFEVPSSSNLKSISNSTPKAPIGASLVKGGGSFSFLDFYKAAISARRTDFRKMFGEWVQYEGLESELEKAFVMLSSDNAMKNEICKVAFEISKDPDTIGQMKTRAMLEYLKAKKPFFPSVPDGALLLVRNLLAANFPTARKEALAKFVDDHRDEWTPNKEAGLPSIFVGMLNRVLYLEQLGKTPISSSTEAILKLWKEHIE